MNIFRVFILSVSIIHVLAISKSRLPMKLSWLNIDKSAPSTKYVAFRGLPTRILDVIDVDQNSKSISRNLPPAFSQIPVLFNTLVAAWLLGSSLSLMSVLAHLKEHPDDNYNEIFDLDRIEVHRWARQSFPLMTPVKKVFGTLVPILRLCQFVDYVLHPDDDDGESWGKLIKSWWNNML